MNIKLSRRGFLIAMGATFITATSGILLRESPISAQTEIVNLDGMLSTLRSRYNVPALAAAFVEAATLKGLGASGLRSINSDVAVTQDDSFHLGSCTKSMTATLIAKLVEEDVLDWETTIAEVFPSRLGKILPEYHAITPIELLSHRSGIPGDQTPDEYLALQSSYWSYSGPIHEQRLALLEDVLSQSPVTEPGTTYNYSNLGYIIAGAMIEELTGKTWEELQTEKIFQPLGMATAGYGAPGTPGAIDQPWGHQGNQLVPVPPGPNADNPPILGPAGRVHCSMGDWAKYASLHLLGARSDENLLLTPASFEKLQTPVGDGNYALGWAVVERDWAGGTALTHTGSNTLWYADIWIAPERNMAFLAATNSGADRAFDACDATISTMIQRYLL